MKLSEGAHDIKHKLIPNDEFYTPKALVQSLISLVPLYGRESILDAAAANPVFFDHFPCSGPRYSTEHFEQWDTPVDWIITNPPYSLLKDWWMPQTFKHAKIGYAYLLGQGNLTPKRIQEANKAGFGLTKIHMCKVFQWYGISYFVVFEKDKPNIVSFDRKVWREDGKK
jgi:hypothetical protein